MGWFQKGSAPKARWGVCREAEAAAPQPPAGERPRLPLWLAAVGGLVPPRAGRIAPPLGGLPRSSNSIARLGSRARGAWPAKPAKKRNLILRAREYHQKGRMESKRALPQPGRRGEPCQGVRGQGWGAKGARAAPR